MLEHRGARCLRRACCRSGCVIRSQPRTCTCRLLPRSLAPSLPTRFSLFRALWCCHSTVCLHTRGRRCDGSRCSAQIFDHDVVRFPSNSKEPTSLRPPSLSLPRPSAPTCVCAAAVGACSTEGLSLALFSRPSHYVLAAERISIANTRFSFCASSVCMSVCTRHSFDLSLSFSLSSLVHRLMITSLSPQLTLMWLAVRKHRRRREIRW